jgi:hypothetical protein
VAEDAKMSDEEWYQLERVSELKMKKLMTVSKSKFYMLKVNYSKLFEQVDFEQADGSADAATQAEAAEQRLTSDLRRQDPNTASSDKQDLLNRLKAPVVNINESAENLNS